LPVDNNWTLIYFFLLPKICEFGFAHVQMREGFYGLVSRLHLSPNES